MGFSELSSPPTSVGAQVTGGALWMHLDKERVVVAIQPDVNQVQVVARRFTLGPQAVARAAPKSNLLCIYCLLISLFVHEPKHQHVFRYGVLMMAGTRPPILSKSIFIMAC